MPPAGLNVAHWLKPYFAQSTANGAPPMQRLITVPLHDSVQLVSLAAVQPGATQDPFWQSRPTWLHAKVASRPSAKHSWMSCPEHVAPGVGQVGRFA